MGDFWHSKTFLVNSTSHSRADDKERSYVHAELAAIIQAKPVIVGRIVAELRERDSLAHSPARQIAQVAIASRCGNSVTHGVSALAAFSAPVFPAKLQGSRELFGGRVVRNPDLRHLQSYEGFKTPLSFLKALPEEHSFLDLFELLLLSAKCVRGHQSMLESQGVELGTVVICGHAAQVTFDHSHACREFVQYVAPNEFKATCEDFAQFTRHTIFRLGNLTDKPLAEMVGYGGNDPKCLRLPADGGLKD